jgi:hypothetical protein
MFRDGLTDVHDECGQLSVVSDDLVQSVDQKIAELSCEFPQISCMHCSV